MEYAREKIRNAPVYAIIGGMHLFQTAADRLDWTADRMKEFGVQHLLGSHCTGVEAVMHLRRRLGLTRASSPVGAVGAVFDLANGIDPTAIAR
jgi:7,8-dihydropterin-6-yl-methyl-4-(beta-D-ribofuranosyl)aminobenzene 5'-phosphate synthase